MCRKNLSRSGFCKSSPLHRKSRPIITACSFLLMQMAGLEPAPTFVDMNLNHTRMPIPPHLQLAGTDSMLSVPCTMRKMGLEPTRPTVTRSLVLLVCQFRHFRELRQRLRYYHSVSRLSRKKISKRIRFKQGPEGPAEALQNLFLLYVFRTRVSRKTRARRASREA